MQLWKKAGFGQWQENPLRSKAGELVNQIIMLMEGEKIVWNLKDCNPKLGMMQNATIASHSFVRKMSSIKKMSIHSVVRKMPYFIISTVWSIQLWEKCFIFKIFPVWSKWNKCMDVGFWKKNKMHKSWFD